MVKNIRLEVKSQIKELPIKSEKRKTINDELYQLNYEEWKALNKCMSLLYADTQDKLVCKSLGVQLPDDKANYGKTFRGFLYDICKDEMVSAGAHIQGAAATRAMDQFKKDKQKGLLKGASSLSSFRRDVPIFMPAPAVKLGKGNKGYTASLALLNRDENRAIGFNSNERIVFDIIKPDASRKAILENIISGQYKLGGCSLSHDGGKWFINISFHFEAQAPTGNNIMGLDIGIHNALAIAVYDASKDSHQRLSWKEALIPGGVIEEVRNEFQKRRRDLGKATKLGNSRNGYKKRNKKLLTLKKRESAFRDQYNHKISSYVIDLAVKRGVGLIQMEDLSGISKDDAFLKNWPYYDLQQKIEYKAAEKGIEVVKIKPQYTSKRCSHCGVINFDVNDTSIHEWECPVCKKKHNRDINAAMNIAIPNIENIIEDQLEIQKVSKIA